MINQAFLPDFSEYFTKDELSDVTVVLEEDDSAAYTGSRAGEKRKAPEADEAEGSLQRTTIPGHSMVLVAFSTFFKAKLKSWSEGPSPKPEIRLSVPAGQLDLGRVLLESMYQSQPALDSLSQAQLLQLLVLADRYGVNKVLIAAVAALQAVPQENLQWETVLGVYALPPGCTDACKQLLPVMQQQLQQQLGDLELAVSDSQKRQRLLALPHKVLLLLLQDEETKVASENTVFRTIESWHRHQQQQQQQGAGLSDEELAQLLQQIRMQHCTQPFVATVLAESPLASKCFSPLDLRMACICSSTGGGPAVHVMAAMEVALCPSLVRFPCWKQPKRPESAMTKLTMERVLSLKDLQLQVEALQKDSETVRYELFEKSWQGEAFKVTLQVSKEVQPSGEGENGPQIEAAAESFSSTPFTVGIFAGPVSLEQNLLRLISFSITAVEVPQPAPGFAFGNMPSKHYVRAMDQKGFGKLMWGWRDYFSCGYKSSWAAVEAHLRASQLVHPGDCLQFKAEFTKVL